jgi:hypothetical protein
MQWDHPFVSSPLLPQALESECGLISILKVIGLASLRCPSMQKSCCTISYGMKLGYTSSAQPSLLVALSKLPIKYFKDKRFEMIHNMY